MKDKQINLFAEMDDPILFKKFKIILMKKDKTVKQAVNEWVAEIVKKESKK